MFITLRDVLPAGSDIERLIDEKGIILPRSAARAAGFVLPIAWPLGFLALALGILANDKQPGRLKASSPKRFAPNAGLAIVKRIFSI